ncbi:phospholipase-like protein [Tanacetum coccineum]|uniref:Phospholipase-like protein n=1 Tax=Tanacetum coccineum TaxID=301880 RepID=A0ABQ5B003_9ASTR
MSCRLRLSSPISPYSKEVYEKKSGSGGGGVVLVVLLWWLCSAFGGGAPVVVLWCCGGVVVGLCGVVLLNMENYEDDPVTLTCRNLDDSQENCVLIHFMSCRQVERSPEDTVVVPLTYHVNGHYIEFGREEFCLITGLRFGPEFSDRYEVGPIPFRRLVFDSDKDGGHVNGQMLLDIINGEEFDNLHDEVAVAVCQLAVLHFVLLGRQLAHNIPDWWLRLIDDKNGTWEIYPWGTLVWAQLYGQLENANVVRAEKLYAAQNRPIPRAAKYTLSGFTWAFKGARPNRRLRPDAFEARAEWWGQSQPKPMKVPEHYGLSNFVLAFFKTRRDRPPGARYTVAKTRTSAMIEKSNKFVIETDFHLMGMLDGSSRPYPSWDDVDIVYMPINSGATLEFKCVLGCTTVVVRILKNVAMISLRVSSDLTRQYKVALT